MKRIPSVPLYLLDRDINLVILEFLTPCFRESYIHMSVIIDDWVIQRQKWLVLLKYVIAHPYVEKYVAPSPRKRRPRLRRDKIKIWHDPIIRTQSKKTANVFNYKKTRPY